MKTLLNNQDAEIATLGSVIIDGKVIESLQDILEPGDFYVTKHQKIFRTMLDMQSQGISTDIVTLSSELSSRGWLDDIGGHNYLMYLTELTPSSANYEYYAKTVKEFSNKRKLVDKLTRIVSDIKDDKIDLDAAVIRMQEVDIASSKKYNLVPISAKDLCKDFEPVETLWGEILYPACITQVNSEPGVGKTTFFYNLGVNGALGNKFLNIAFPKRLKILYIDVETPEWKRNLKLHTVSDAGEPLPENLYFLNSLELKSDFLSLLNLCNKEKYDVVILDTQSRILNLEQENDNSQANRMMCLLRRLSNDTGCSIVLIHHTSKSKDKKGVYSGRGASAIGAAVDVVVNMEMLEEEDAIKLKVDKNRVLGDYQTLFIRKIGEDRFEPFVPSDKSYSGFEKFNAQDFILGLADEKNIWQTSELYSEGEKQGFSESTIKRAKDNLSQSGKLRRIRHGVYEIVTKGQKVKSSDPIGGNNELLNFSRKTFEQMPDKPQH